MSKKAKKIVAIRTTERQKPGGRIERNAAGGKEAADSRAGGAVSRSIDLEHKYDYIKSDLLQIAAITAALIIILILASMFIKV